MFDLVELNESFSNLGNVGSIVFIDNSCFVILSKSTLAYDDFVHVSQPNYFTCGFVKRNQL